MNIEMERLSIESEVFVADIAFKSQGIRRAAMTYVIAKMISVDAERRL